MRKALYFGFIPCSKFNILPADLEYLYICDLTMKQMDDIFNLELPVTLKKLAVSNLCYSNGDSVYDNRSRIEVYCLNTLIQKIPFGCEIENVVVKDDKMFINDNIKEVQCMDTILRVKKDIINRKYIELPKLSLHNIKKHENFTFL
jgi:hypothetical protein